MSGARGSKVAAALLATLLIALAPAKRADAILIDMTTQTLEPGSHIRDVVVRNPGSQAAIVQIDAERWQAGENGAIMTAATQDLIIAPSVFTIGPNGLQVVRVAWRSAPTDGEHAYRLRVRQVGTPGTTLVSAALGAQFIVYLFAATPVMTKPAVSTTLARVDEGHALVTFVNAGQLHANVGAISIERDGKELYHARPFTLLLGNARRSVSVAIPKGTPVVIHYEIDGHRLKADVDAS